MNISRKTILFLVKLVLSVSMLLFLVHTTQIKVELVANLFQHPSLFCLLIFTILFMVVLASRRWYTLNVAEGIRLSFFRTFLATYIGNAFNNLLPGAVGGDFLRCYYLFKKIPDKKSSALISIFFDRFLGFVGIILTILFVAVLNVRFFYQHHLLFYLLSLCIAFAAVSLSAIAILVVLPHRSGLLNWLMSVFEGRKWVYSFSSLLNALRAYRVPFKTIIECLTLSVILQFLFATCAMLIGEMMGFSAIPLSSYAIAVGITLIVNLIPITPGGIGLGEIAFANILFLLTPEKSSAYATIFLTLRLVNILAYLPAVLLCIPRFLFLRKNSTVIAS